MHINSNENNRFNIHVLVPSFITIISIVAQTFKLQTFKLINADMSSTMSGYSHIEVIPIAQYFYPQRRTLYIKRGTLHPQPFCAFYRLLMIPFIHLSLLTKQQ